MQDDSGARMRRVARFAASHAAWRAKNPQWAILPASFAPLPVDHLPALCGPVAGRALDSADERCRRKVAATLARAGIVGRLPSLLSKAELGVYSGYRGQEKRNPSRLLETAFASQSPEARASGIQTISHGDLQIAFNPETFVSTCEVKGLKFRMSTDFLLPFFQRAEPQNWSTESEVFLRSDAVKPQGNGWVRIDPPWPQSGQGLLYEIAVAQVNELVGTEAHNILSISNFKNEFGLAGDTRKSELTFHYDYALARALGSKLGVLWEPEGLDIDGGYYTAKATRRDKDEWDVVVEISKSLRYVLPENAPRELSSVLNTLAPALLTIFMQELSLDTVSLAATLSAAPLPPAPPPPGQSSRPQLSAERTVSAVSLEAPKVVSPRIV